MRLPDGRCHGGDNLLEERGEKTTGAQLVAEIPRYFLAARHPEHEEMSKKMPAGGPGLLVMRFVPVILKVRDLNDFRVVHL
jgi:hypothetical protein